MSLFQLSATAGLSLYSIFTSIPLYPTFLLVQHLSSKQIVPTENMQPKLQDRFFLLIFVFLHCHQLLKGFNRVTFIGLHIGYILLIVFLDFAKHVSGCNCAKHQAICSLSDVQYAHYM